MPEQRFFRPRFSCGICPSHAFRTQSSSVYVVFPPSRAMGDSFVKGGRPNTLFSARSQAVLTKCTRAPFQCPREGAGLGKGEITCYGDDLETHSASMVERAQTPEEQAERSVLSSTKDCYLSGTSMARNRRPSNSPRRSGQHYHKIPVPSFPYIARSASDHGSQRSIIHLLISPDQARGGKGKSDRARALHAGVDACSRASLTCDSERPHVLTLVAVQAIRLLRKEWAESRFSGSPGVSASG